MMGSRFPKGHQIDLGGIDGGVGIGQLCTFCGQSKFVISFHQRCFKRTASNFPSPLRLDFVRSWAKNVVKSYESRVFFITQPPTTLFRWHGIRGRTIGMKQTISRANCLSPNPTSAAADAFFDTSLFPFLSLSAIFLLGPADHCRKELASF